MILLERLIRLGHAAAALALLFSYWQHSGLSALPAAFTPLLVWLILRRLRPSAAASAAFAAVVLLTIAAAVRGHSGGPLLGALLAATLVWDLSGFQQRIVRYETYTANSQVVRSHLNLLTAVASMTVALFLIVRAATVQLSFWPALMLSAVILFGMAQAFRFLRQSD